MGGAREENTLVSLYKESLSIQCYLGVCIACTFKDCPRGFQLQGPLIQWLYMPYKNPKGCKEISHGNTIFHKTSFAANRTSFNLTH
jgi:hypothetical protein